MRYFHAKKPGFSDYLTDVVAPECISPDRLTTRLVKLSDGSLYPREEMLL
ncbi:hypothetical protein H6S82_18070 [Planktothrix sp. FACHB-1355]|nr:hypothetical protein [Planktothrix sp. FACHB-1355]MBD3560740.1 hypothetical protein [Planktothrix sp. FACHB-1355]